MLGKCRRSVFLVVYARDGGKTSYLLLRRALHWSGWEFPKGGIESWDKNMVEAARREVKEETGLEALKINDMKKTGRFEYKRGLPDRPGFREQAWRLFAVEVRKERVRFDKREHKGCKWLGYKEAYKLLTWPDQKACLKLVEKSLKGYK